MDSFIGIIILGVVFSIISSISKNAKKQQQQQRNNSNTNQKTTLQSQLNSALKQINDIKNYVSDEVNGATQQRNQSVQTTQNKRQPYNSSLEGHRMEGHIVEGHQMEGHIVEGHKVEGHKVEGIDRRHNTNKYNKDRIVHTESSMQRGYAGEGCDEHYDMGIKYSAVSKKGKKNPLYFSDNPIVQGVVMSQVLERGKRR